MKLEPFHMESIGNDVTEFSKDKCVPPAFHRRRSHTIHWRRPALAALTGAHFCLYWTCIQTEELCFGLNYGAVNSCFGTLTNKRSLTTEAAKYFRASLAAANVAGRPAALGTRRERKMAGEAIAHTERAHSFPTHSILLSNSAPFSDVAGIGDMFRPLYVQQNLHL
jgi:hypothetical protein